MVKSNVLECNEFQANLEKYVLSFELYVSAISRDDFWNCGDCMNLKKLIIDLEL